MLVKRANAVRFYAHLRTSWILLLTYAHASFILSFRQVLKNYRLQTADSLSFTFLVVWLTGT